MFFEEVLFGCCDCLVVLYGVGYNEFAEVGIDPLTIDQFFDDNRC